MEIAQQITEGLVEEVKRRVIEECVPRIGICLNQLSTEQIWWSPNSESNSIGNLILHLNGNVRQWILSGVGKQPDVRKRQSEFNQTGGLDAEQLMALLHQTMDEVSQVLEELNPPDLMEVRSVQVYEESVLTMLIHVTEHFSYHTGQIAWITKMLKEQQLGFYADIDLG